MFYHGLIHIFSAMEQCNTYKPWHDKVSGKTFLKFDQSKCLHYYFYFIDKEPGLCYLRVPTWAPFRLQFYMNGHNLLAHKLQKKNISYRMHDNAFLEISDVEAAQKLSDRINPEGLHKALDVFAKRYCPVADSLGLAYTWTVQQIECATDIWLCGERMSAGMQAEKTEAERLGIPIQSVPSSAVLPFLEQTGQEQEGIFPEMEEIKLC